jgi:hypothetical protein
VTAAMHITGVATDLDNICVFFKTLYDHRFVKDLKVLLERFLIT